MSRRQWEKEKLPVTSNFSFPHSVFKRLLLQICKSQGSFWKGLRKRNDVNIIINENKNIGHMVANGRFLNP